MSWSIKMGNVVLLVEDDEPIRDMFKFALEVEGYTVFTADNGREGIDALAKIPRPNLILLDLMMPVMDGWSFVNALEAQHAYATIPVVVITAFDLRDRPIHAQRILKKPLELEQLYEVAREYCQPNI